jgi:hypothetical protein
MLIEVDGDVAVAETYQFSFFWRTPGTDPLMNFLNSNRYADVFERRQDQWRIFRRDFIRNFTVPVLPERFPTPENGWIMPMRGRGDLGYRSVADVVDLIDRERGT